MALFHAMAQLKETAQANNLMTQILIRKRRQKNRQMTYH